MRVLAVDTATEASSVALLSGEELISRRAEGGLSHAQQILGMVEAVLAEAQVSLSVLDGIAASIGPGSFTGVRISVAVAQGLAFGAGLRIVPVSTLEALAFQAVRSGAAHALACLDARMGEVYWGCFTADLARGVTATCPASAAALPPIRRWPHCRVSSSILTTDGHCRTRANSRGWARCACSWRRVWIRPTSAHCIYAIK
jgi:tRNA threonylcarbamoyladenosine biosynthesis protein TsaB